MRIKNALTLLAMALSIGMAHAAFPDKPVRLIVPYPPGGATDASARLVVERLTEIWHQPVVIENRPGANGAIGTAAVARATPDGYTLLLQVPIMLSTELIRPSVSYRTLRDFVPVTTVFTTPIVYLASNSGAPPGGLKEIIAAAKAAPGTISYANHGEGTTTSYMGEKLKKVTGINMTPVPYNGDNPILVDLLGGHVTTGFVSGSNAVKAEEMGKARILAVASAKRSPLLPNAPTFLEQGIEGFERESWGRIFAPAGTPQPIVTQIARDISAVVRTPDVQRQFGKSGLVSAGGTPEETLKDVQAEYVYWVRLIREFGILTKQP